MDRINEIIKFMRNNKQRYTEHDIDDISRLLDELRPELKSETDKLNIQLGKLIVSDYRRGHSILTAKAERVIGIIINKIKAMIMQNIEMVQKDKDYVNQAKVVNSGIQTIVNLLKQEIDAARVINKF